MLTKGKKVIMKYDFTSILDRTGKDAIAVEQIPIPGAQVKEGFDRIPMWVADMNFPTAPTVVEAMMERVQHPAYGYFDPSEEYYASIIRWQEKRNGVNGLEPEHIGYENGVLGGVISAECDVFQRGQRTASFPDLYRLYHESGKQRISYCTFSAGKG